MNIPKIYKDNYKKGITTIVNIRYLTLKALQDLVENHDNVNFVCEAFGGKPKTIQVTNKTISILLTDSPPYGVNTDTLKFFNYLEDMGNKLPDLLKKQLKQHYKGT